MAYRNRPKCTMCPMMHMCMYSNVCKPNTCYPGMMPMGQGMQSMGQMLYPMGQSMYPMGQQMPSMGQGMYPMSQQMPTMGQEMAEGNYPTVVSPEFLPGTVPNYSNIPMPEKGKYHKKHKKHHKHDHEKDYCKNHGHYSSD